MQHARFNPVRLVAWTIYMINPEITIVDIIGVGWRGVSY